MIEYIKTKDGKIKGRRQGDVIYASIKNLPKGLEEVKTNTILATGSGGNPHTFTGGKFYPKDGDQFVIGYLKASKTKLSHAEHGKDFKLPNGIYEVRRQSEDTIEGLKQVVD